MKVAEIDKLREKFFEECTDSDDGKLCKVNMAPHDLFEWVRKHIEPFDGFWNRLRSFVADIQVGDAMSEEEKEMILNVCDKML